MVAVFLISVVFIFAFILVQGNPQGKKQLTEKAASRNALFAGYYKHCVGLPLQEEELWLYQFPDQLLFVYGDVEFKISYDKVLNISLKSETEITKQYVSSSGGAIAGGILFGPIGAFIGGRTRTKKDISNIEYLLITYTNKDNGVSSVGLENCITTLSNKALFIEYFSEHSNRDKKTVTL